MNETTVFWIAVAKWADSSHAYLAQYAERYFYTSKLEFACSFDRAAALSSETVRMLFEDMRDRLLDRWPDTLSLTSINGATGQVAGRPWSAYQPEITTASTPICELPRGMFDTIQQSASKRFNGWLSG